MQMKYFNAVIAGILARLPEPQFCAVGRWSGLDCEIKGSGPIMSNF